MSKNKAWLELLQKQRVVLFFQKQGLIYIQIDIIFTCRTMSAMVLAWTFPAELRMARPLRSGYIFSCSSSFLHRDSFVSQVRISNMTAFVSSAEEELLLAAAAPLGPAAAPEVAGLCSSFSTVQTRVVHDVAYKKKNTSNLG